MTGSDSEDDLFDSEGDVEEELMEGLDDIEVEEGTEAGDLQSGSEDTTSEDDDDDDEGDDDDEDDDVMADNITPVKTEDVPKILPPKPLSTTQPAIRQLTPPIEKSETVIPTTVAREPSPPKRPRSPSPAELRRRGLLAPIGVGSRTYTVEAICAIPHPTPTHALASSACITHLLTGSDDGYIRDYDVFSAVNGKTFLTAPQRQHTGVVEGLMKAGQLRSWWENPLAAPTKVEDDELVMSPVYSLACHSDALWALAGSNVGHVNLFTVRHEPGRFIHSLAGHRGPISALAIQHDEKGFFSAGWDGLCLQWDLNTGQFVRNFVAHGAQLTGVAVRPIAPPSASILAPNNHSIQATERVQSTQPMQTDTPQAPESAVMDVDAKSDASYDPLFDDDDDPAAVADGNDKKGGASDLQLPSSESKPNIVSLAMPGQGQQQPSAGRAAIPPKNAPPLLDHDAYSTFSPDILMTSAVDGQVILWDRRVNTPGKGVGRLWMSDKTPPWCLSACWSADGGQIYAGRRNGTVDIWDTRQMGQTGPSNTPTLLKTLRNPASSGVVSCVVAFPDCRHIACASSDNIRLWNAAEAGETDSGGIGSKSRSGAQFKIIPGHHGGYVSQMLIDPGARFMVTASSNRGWHGESTKTVFIHDIKLSP